MGFYALRIKKKIDTWTQAGFISEEQAEQILDFEYKSGKKRWSNISLYAFLILGGVVVSTGVISIIAANWEDIPAAAKLSVDFAMLVGLALGVLWSQTKQKTILFDFQSTLFVLGCLASIGLISQIFHTGGKIYQALALWLIITGPLCYFGKRMFLPSLWSAGLLVSFLVWAFCEESWWATNFLASQGYAYIRDDNIFPVFYDVALWTLLLASLAAHFSKLERFQINFQFWGLLACMSAVLAGDLFLSFEADMSSNALYPSYVLLPASLIALIARPNFGRLEKGILGTLLSISLLVYLPLFGTESMSEFRMGSQEISQILGALYFIVSSILLALYFTVRRRFWLFHTMTIIIGTRFVIVYFQVFEDLAFTGIGLILSGFVIITLAVVWYRFRLKLESWAQRLIG